MNEVEQKMFEKYKCDGKQVHECKHGDDYMDRCMGWEVDGCKGCESTLIHISYPPITAEKLWKIEDILNEEYNILIIEKMSASTKITASPAPEQDWGCDEAYYRLNIEEKTKEIAICQLATKAYDNIPAEMQARIKTILEAS